MNESGIEHFANLVDKQTIGFALVFDADRLEMSLQSFSAGEIPTVPVIEVRV